MRIIVLFLPKSICISCNLTKKMMKRLYHVIECINESIVRIDIHNLLTKDYKYTAPTKRQYVLRTCRIHSYAYILEINTKSK